MALLRLENIKAGYEDNIVLDNFNLEVEEGELVSFLGPSGCGKTTTLRVIAGFVKPQEGHVYVSDKDYTPLAVHKKNFGFVFQSYALFPHLSVFDNVAFGLKLRDIEEKKIEEKVENILTLVGLEKLMNRYPGELSGGQKQRVALSRALVIEPDLLLLDEPLSNLDAKLRVQMRREIKELQSKLGVTTVYVTHDQEECFSISDRVVIMRDGEIEQFNTPEIIYHYPRTQFVAEFVGFKNFLELEYINESFVTKDGVKFSVDSERIMPSAENEKEVLGAIRPNDIELEVLTEEGNGDFDDNSLRGEVTLITYLGNEYEYVVETSVKKIIVNQESTKRIEKGEKVNLYFPPNKLIMVK